LSFFGFLLLSRLIKYGSAKTQNVEDAIAFAQSGEPLARGVAKQMPAMWQRNRIAYRLSVLWLLPWATSIDARGKVV
jgi:hypothetical protein